MKKPVIAIFLMCCLMLAGCGRTGKDSADEIQTLLEEEEPTASLIVQQPTEEYEEIKDIFSGICSNAEISVTNIHDRLNVKIVTDISAEQEAPEGWADTITALGSALELAQEQADGLGVSVISAEIDSMDKEILASGFQGEVKYNLFEKAEEEQPSTTENPSIGTAYILNTNTKKFHYSNCSSANKISTKNRSSYTGDRSDLINQGYSPCGKCHP